MRSVIFHHQANYPSSPSLLLVTSAGRRANRRPEVKPEEIVPAELAPRRALNINKVGVEVELVDSESGGQIAATVDRANLGVGAETASLRTSRDEKFRLARLAFDEWASRVRQFWIRNRKSQARTPSGFNNPIFLQQKSAFTHGEFVCITPRLSEAAATRATSGRIGSGAAAGPRRSVRNWLLLPHSRWVARIAHDSRH